MRRPARGKTGHASLALSQTVITSSHGWSRKRSRVLDVCDVMSMPRSAIALMASGWTRVASVPALSTSMRPPPAARSSPSAIWLRDELWVHRMRTRFVSLMRWILPRRAPAAPNRLDSAGAALYVGRTRRPDMRRPSRRALFVVLVAVTSVLAPWIASAQDKPRHGGELIFVVPSEPPSYDGH